MFPKIAIIILNWNGMQDTLACLQSLEKLSYPHFEVIVVDNGSTDGSAQAIRAQFPQYQLIETGANLGFAEGNNRGIRKGIEEGADLLFLLNNDTLVASDILERFAEIYHSRPEAGILGAKIFLLDQKDTLDHLGGLWDAKTGTFTLVGLRQKDSPRWQDPEPLDYACGAGLIIKRSVIEAIGYLDKRFFLIWEESDFCFRAKKAGFQTLTCPKAHLWHKVSASFVGGKPHSTYFWWRNRLLWIEKNCSCKDQCSLYLRVLIPTVLQKLKLYFIKKMQLIMLQWFMKDCNLEEKKDKLLGNRAALCGIRDYFLRRFGNGPDWIYKKGNRDSI
jgi:GT2 family glycosyltransferase